MRMSVTDIYVSREDLHKMVWATPIQRLAKEYGISDVALAKICAKLGVPRPPRGYWARKAAGHRMTSTPLPPRTAKQREGVYLSLRPEPQPAMELSEDTVDLIEQLTKSQSEIFVPESLAKPHPLIRSTKQGMSKSGSDMYGALWRDEGCLDLRVSKRSLMRSLLLMDTVLKQLEKLDFEVTINERGETVIEKDDVKMKIRLYERTTRIEQVLTDKQKIESWRYDKYRFEPSGEFELILTRWPLNERHWKDSHKRKLESRLKDILVEIIRSNEIVKFENERREIERLRWVKQMRLEEAERQKRIEEERRREELEKQAGLWLRANDLRRFLEACKAEFSSPGSLELETPAGRWLQWAYEHADRIDPIKNGFLIESLDPRPQT